MALTSCSKCGAEISVREWTCSKCGEPALESAGAPAEREVSPKGMIAILLLCVAFPVLLFLIHIFVPGM
jgi:hypothetical protein